MKNIKDYHGRLQEISNEICHIRNDIVITQSLLPAGNNEKDAMIAIGNHLYSSYHDLEDAIDSMGRMS